MRERDLNSDETLDDSGEHYEIISTKGELGDASISMAGTMNVDAEAQRFASPQRRLDLLMEEALDAWIELGPDGDGARIEAPREHLADAVFEAQRRATPRLVTMDLETPPQAAARRRRGKLWEIVGAVAAAAAVVTGAAWLVPGGPGDASEDALAVTAPVDPVMGTGGAPGLPEEDRGPLTVPADLDDKVEKYIAKYGENYGPAFKFHGVVVVAQHGRIAYKRGFGTATPDGDPNTIDTRFRLGLLTEPLTAVAVMQLVEAELLSLDDRVAKYLPDYPRGEQITVRDLLTHRSGIPNYTDEPGFHRWKDEAHTTDQMIERFAKLSLDFEPGSDTSPSNSNYFLLGAIIERVTGQTFAQFVEQGQFVPAGMEFSTFGDAFETGEQARGNVWNDDELLDPPDPVHMSTFGAAGGVVSSPMDLVRWEQALLRGDLLGSDALEQISTPSDDGYGFGWVISRAYGQPLLSFPGAIDGYSGAMLRFERDETTIIVLANTEVVPGSVVAQDVAMMVYGDAPPERNEPAEIDIAPDTYVKYLGTYAVTDKTRAQYGHLFDSARFDLLSRVHVERDGDRLYFDVPGHARTWMHPMGRNRFFFKDHSGNQVSFVLGDDRLAEQLVVHYHDAEFELSRLP